MNKAQLETRKAAVELQIANLKLLSIQQSFLPHHNLPIRVYREGSRWVCILETDEELLNCVVAYGGSPAQACANFDSLWNEGYIIEEPEEEEF